LVIQIGEQIDVETNAETKVDVVFDSESPSTEAVNGEETLEDTESTLWNQVSPIGGRRRHACLKEYVPSGTSREEYKSTEMKKSQRQKMREKSERTKRAKEAREKQIERFKFAVEAQTKLEEALQKKRHWQKNCTVFDRGDPGSKLSDTELMHLHYRVVKTLGVLNAVIDPENQRVIGLVASCKQSMDPRMYQWRTLLSWIGEFLRNGLKFKRVI